MKKIINGKVYDTAKATEVGIYDRGLGWRDFNNIVEILYRKRTGEYFLYGSGGPMTKYAEATGTNSWSGGERIMPVAYDEAKQWAEKWLSSDAYEKEFGKVIEDESTEVISISIPSSASTKLRRAAQEKGISLSAYIASLA